MKTPVRSLVHILVLVASCACAFSADHFAIKGNDLIVFYGDSITDQRLYTTFAETYVVTRFPHFKVQFVHSGWGGDRVTGGGGGPIDKRLERDVVAYKPTVMTIMLGMNDGSYRAFDQDIFDAYAHGYEHIINSVKSALPDIRITLIEPSPFDDVTRPAQFEGGYNSVLLRYGLFVKQLAEHEHLIVADLNTPVVDALRKASEIDAETAKKIIPDRVHPGPGGHLLMAEALLKSWKAPAIVSAVEIDANDQHIARSENTSLTALTFSHAVSWTQTDMALPMPIDLKDPVVALAMRSSDFVDALDQQPLRVRGLTAGRYMLRVGGEEVGSFTKEQLAEGVNLATLSTPMTKQAAKVHDLTLQHNAVHFGRWRNVQVPLEGLTLSNKQAALTQMDTLEAEIVQQQRAAAEPKPQRYELVPE